MGTLGDLIGGILGGIIKKVSSPLIELPTKSIRNKKQNEEAIKNGSSNSGKNTNNSKKINK